VYRLLFLREQPVEKSVGTIVEHNTVLVEGYWAPMQVRGGSGHVFRNNLTNLPIQLHDGAFVISNQGNGNIECTTQDGPGRAL